MWTKNHEDPEKLARYCPEGFKGHQIDLRWRESELAPPRSSWWPNVSRTRNELRFRLSVATVRPMIQRKCIPSWCWIWRTWQAARAADRPCEGWPTDTSTSPATKTPATASSLNTTTINRDITLRLSPVLDQCEYTSFCVAYCWVVSVLDSDAEGPGFKSQSRCCRVTVLGKLFTPIVPLFTKQQNW